jgi:hypothetical protein
MASDPPKRSDDETEAETVKRRLIETVREQIDEIGQRVRDEHECNTRHDPSGSTDRNHRCGRD